MANYYLQEMGDMDNDGQTRVYPKVEVYSQISKEDFIKSIRQRSGVFSEGVVEGIFITLADCMKNWLSEGHTVKIEGLGTFSLSLRFADGKGNDTSAELTNKRRVRHVEVRGLNFKADPDLVKELRMETKLQRKMTGVRQLKKKIYSMEEKHQRALEKIMQQGFITLQQYANLNNVSRTTASKELRALCKDPKSGIGSQGQASHKIWMKKSSDAEQA